MRKTWVTGVSVVSLVGAVAAGQGGCSSNAPHDTTSAPRTSEAPPPSSTEATQDLLVHPHPSYVEHPTPAQAKAAVADHKVIDWSTYRVVGDETSTDLRVHTRLRGEKIVRDASTPHPADWFVATGAPVHASPATFSAWTSNSPNDILVFAVDGTSATRGVPNGIGQANDDTTNSATGSAALLVFSDLYDTSAGLNCVNPAAGCPSVVGYALDSSLSESFGLPSLVLNVAGTQVYALSRSGHLYCFNLPSSRGLQASPPASAMTACSGSWPYAAGHNVTYSSPYPLYGTTDVTAMYFGDDSGTFHCVKTTGSPGTSCWSGAPAGTALVSSGAAQFGSPVVEADSTAGGNPVVFVGDSTGRFFRVEDTGVAPTPAPSADVASFTLSGSGGSAAVLGAPVIDFNRSHVYAVSAGNMYEFPLPFTSSWNPTSTSPSTGKTLVTSALNGAVLASPIIDYTNNYAYITFHNTLYKATIPFNTSATANLFSIPLVEQVATAPASGDATATDNFPLGWALPYYNSVFVESGTNAGTTGGVEEYGCQAAASAPVLEGITTSHHGVLVETGMLLDWQNGNLNYGVATSSNTGGIVQYPATNPPTTGTSPQAGFTCPGNTAGSSGLACGAVGCAPTCTTCNSVGGDTAACVSNVCTVTSCPAGTADCNNNASDGCEVNFNTDPNNCGGCVPSNPPQVGSPTPAVGKACSMSNDTPTCSAGSCVYTCNAGFTRCSTDSTNDGCPTAIKCGQTGSTGNCCGNSCDLGSVCASNGSCSSTLPSRCLTASEGQSLTLSCAETDQVIASITFVSYGTPTANCGGVGSCDTPDVATSGSDSTVLNGSGGVATETELQFVQNLCLGKASCAISASDTTAQGPFPQRQFGTGNAGCAGNNAKTLAVSFTCSCPTCETNADCSGATPTCETGSHQCGPTSGGGACGADADCAASANGTHCNTATGQCGQCNADTDCGAGQGCDTTPTAFNSNGQVTSHNVCVACVTNANCGSGKICNTTAPSSSSYACVGCLSSSDCSGATPACNTTSHTCVACTSDANCSGATPACDTTTNTCAVCFAGDSTNFCSSSTSGHACVPGDTCGCNTATDCTGTGFPACNTTTHKCVGCAADSDCSGATPQCDTTTATCAACAVHDDSGGTVGGADAVCTAAVGNTCLATDTCGCTTNANCTVAGSTQCDTSLSACEFCAVASDSGGAVGGANAVCTTSVGNTCLANHTCGCSTDANCSGASPQCDTGTNACATCSVHDDAGGVVGGANSVCTGAIGNTCLANDTCGCSTDANCGGATPQCDTTTHQCKACAVADDSGGTVGGSNSVCTGNVGNTCLATDTCGCTSDSNCPNANFRECDTSLSQCFLCTVQDDSGGAAGGANLACTTNVGNTCVSNTTHACGCVSDSNCTGTRQCDTSTGALKDLCHICAVHDNVGGVVGGVNFTVCPGTGTSGDTCNANDACGCADDTNCTHSRPFCNTGAHTCATCTVTNDCNGTLGGAASPYGHVCRAGGTCGCTNNGNCTGSPLGTVCGPGGGTANECGCTTVGANSPQCTSGAAGFGKNCINVAGYAHECGCATNGDCNSGLTCDTTVHRCQ